jgi:outer membrane autotransporter protein
MLVGVDVISNSVARFGIAAGYSQTRLKTNGAADTGRSDAYHVGVYGSFNSSGWFAQGVGQVAIFDQSLSRLGISGAQGAAVVPAGDSSFRGSAFEVDARFGHAFLIAGGATVAPYAAATARWQEAGAFRETGAGVFSLDAQPNSQHQFAFGPGVRVSSAPMALNSATLRVAADIAYARLTGDLRHDTNVTLLGRQIQGRTAAIGRDVLRVGGQLSLASQDEKFSGFIGYNGSFQQKAVSHVMSAGVNVRF